MKDFLRLNLILSTEKLDENDEEESLTSNLNTTGGVKKVLETNQSFNNKSTSLLYVKSIKKFENNAVEKNLQPNDLVIKVNDQVVNTLEEFKLMLYNLNKTFIATNVLQMVCLTVKRRNRLLQEDVNEDNTNLVQNSILSFDSHHSTLSINGGLNNKDDLNDVNITVASNRRNIDESLIETNDIQNYQMWFSEQNCTQFFFPLYSHDNVITEEYLQAYNTFSNLDMIRLESLFEAMKNKVLGKTNDYIQEFKVLKTASIAVDSSRIANYNDENRSKNRYRNVVPYDYNRVKLIEDPQNNDYINASHICLPLHSSQKNEFGLQHVSKYIIAQPPLNNTICKKTFKFFFFKSTKLCFWSILTKLCGKGGPLL
jgi:hypothetical protein